MLTIGLRPKQHARMGMFHLEEAILDVLLEAKHEGRCIGAAEISKRSGIFRERGKTDIMNDAIATGILVKLHEENRVARCKQHESKRGEWEMLPPEFELRRDDDRWNL